MANYNPNHKIVLDTLLLPHPLVRAGKMFGFPAYYTGSKLCICLYEEGVGIKLPASTVARLLESDPNAIPFQPLGKPKMREWVQINLADSEVYALYEPVFIESIQFVHEQQQGGKA
jgi:hypothetical protein